MEEKIAKELCGLANTKGGHLLIGVGDDGGVEGLARGGGRLQRKERDGMLAWVTNVIVDYLGVEHDGRFCREIVAVDGRDVLCCAVEASEDGPVVLKKRLDGKHDFFVRAGSTCRPLNSKEVLEFTKARWPERTSPQPEGHPAPDLGNVPANTVASPNITLSVVGSVRQPRARRVRVDRPGGRPRSSRPGGRHGGGRPRTDTTRGGGRYGDTTGGRSSTNRSGSRSNTGGRHGGGRPRTDKTRSGGRYGTGGGRYGGGRRRSGSSPRRGRRR